MKKNFTYTIAITLCIILAACSKTEISTETDIAQTDEKNISEEPKTIIALGDSITAGYTLPIEDAYPAQLEALLQENEYNYKLINAGVSGDTSSQLLKRIDLYLEDESDLPDIAILVIGGNDGLRGQSTIEMQKNIEEIVDRLQAKNVEVVLGGMQIPPNNGLSYFNAFKKVYKDVAKEKDIELIPFFLDDVATKGIYNLPDMIHPNKDGYAIIAQNTFDFLKKHNIIQND